MRIFLREELANFLDIFRDTVHLLKTINTIDVITIATPLKETEQILNSLY